ncbi:MULTISPECIES: cbb3-type cytochrome c oxidase N-terminal domain-containing protein [Chryseobacterium]|jgi:cytochrome c oxidase cbb3-type subunit 3|uniref:Cytochrome c oxidase cbb3-type subunit 3 n=2 Tax=Chryseobacterium TaxID=59732 RepID=A0AAX2IIM6_9FLAO|nr:MULTISPECIES: cbb3-type cytochrome c oxidase N-terminal domain-containing protein [Chryseobacterium]AZB31555.1 cytochrome C [Chryseobacterium balustinum]REC55988.1 cytochrome C [Chryseobacterium piscium]SKB79724.1 cytochrome c oxidase cbb3-type subunit 3 [Chryseobacterium balustinum]SQA88306.1 Cytochrome c oxidase subunit III [Chryseobacterium balustinum]
MRQRTPVVVNILIITVLLVIFYYLFVQSYSFLASPYFWGTVVISAILAYIHSAIGDLIENNKFKKLTAEEKSAYLAEKKIPFLRRQYDAAFKKQSDTHEKDILIDHGFDGIMELDNQLPKWWLGLFYFGTVFCIVYICAYAFTDFAHPISEYDKEYKEQEAAIAQYLKDQPPVTIESAAFSEDNIAAGEEIFKTNCVSCHSDGGKGGIGPNLTDNFWHNQPEKTLFKNVFHVVENGVTGTAMQAWGKNGVLTGGDIEKVAAYVYSINQLKKPITPKDGGAPPYGDEAHWEKQ